MPTPKSVTKVLYKEGKTSIEFTDSVDKTQYFLYELNRGALRDVGKFVCKKFLESFDSTFKKHTGKARKGVKYDVWSSKNTIYPKVEIGIKPDIQSYGPFEELGSSKTQKYGLLKSAVYDNIDTIIEIESKYLSAIDSGESTIKAKIDEKEQEGDADGQSE